MTKSHPTPCGSCVPAAETDQRRACRIPVSFSLQFSGRQRLGKTGAGLLADLSETGCRVQSTSPMKVGASLALVAELSCPVLITEARVAWVAGQWSGLEFLRVSPTERTRLRRFLWKHMSRDLIDDQRPLFALVSSSPQTLKGLRPLS